MDETQLSPEDLEYASRLPLPGQEVSRAGNILGAARQGLVSSVVTPLAGIARLTGMEQAPRLAEILRRNQEEGGGMYPTNPDMSKDFSTGVARAVGAAPATMLQAAGGLPVLVGGGVLSGVESYGERKEDYDRRLAAGQLEPGEEAPSALSEVGKGAASNAAFLVGGMGAGRLAAPILSRLSGTPARILAGYGATVGGNLAGSAAARKIETGSFGYENPAAMGEDFFTAGGTFGPIPTKHLLEAPASKYKSPEARALERAAREAERAAAQAQADAAAAAAEARARAASTSVTSQNPNLTLSPMSQNTSQVEQMVSHIIPGSMEGTTVPDQWPYIGTATPGERHIVSLAGQHIARMMLGEGDIASFTMPTELGTSRMDREAAAKQHALWRIREAIRVLQTPGQEGNDLAAESGLSRNHATAAFLEAQRILNAGEPITPDISVEQQLATRKGAAVLDRLNELMKAPATPEAAPLIAAELNKPEVREELKKSGLPTPPTDYERLQPKYVQELTALLNARDEEIAAASEAARADDEAAHRESQSALAAKYMAEALAGPGPTPEQQQQIWEARREALRTDAAEKLKAKLAQEEADAAAAAEAKRIADAEAAEKEAADQAAAHGEALPATALTKLGERLRVGKPIAETGKPGEATTPTTTTNETGQNIQQIPHPEGQPPIVPANNAPTGVRGLSELGTGTEEKPLQQQGGHTPVGETDDAAAGVRGQGQLGEGSEERPVLGQPGYRHVKTPLSRDYQDHGGWKLHLPVDPANHQAVDEWLDQNHPGQYKLGMGGDRGTSDFTVYVGDKAKAQAFAAKIESEIGHLLEKPLDLGADTPFGEKVTGRFDPRGKVTKWGEHFNSYGLNGIPFDDRGRMLANGVRNASNPAEKAKWQGLLDAHTARIERELTEKYGSRYTGNPDPAYTAQEQGQRKALQDTIDRILKLPKPGKADAEKLGNARKRLGEIEDEARARGGEAPPAPAPPAKASEAELAGRAVWYKLGDQERLSLKENLEAILAKKGSLEWTDLPKEIVDQLDTGDLTTIKRLLKSDPRAALDALVPKSGKAAAALVKAPATPAAEPLTPESPATLVEQQRQLIAGIRPAMLYPQIPGQPIASVVPPGMKSTRTPRGVYVFNPKLISEEQLRALDAAGRQGEALNLGKETKAEAVAAPGKYVVLTEHTPDGVEVRASVTSEGELEAKRAEFEKTKTPGNIIGTRTADEVIAARKSATELDTTSGVTGDEYIGGLSRPGQKGVALGTVGDKVRIKWEDGKVTDEEPYKVMSQNRPETAHDVLRDKIEPAMKKGQPIPSEWVNAVQPPRVKGVVENVPQTWIRRHLEIEGYREKDGQWVKVAEREGPPESATKGDAGDRAKYHNRVIKMSDAELAKELANPPTDRWKWETLQISKLYADLRAHNREAEAGKPPMDERIDQTRINVNQDILDTGKWPNGKKATPAERVKLQQEIDELKEGLAEKQAARGAKPPEAPAAAAAAPTAEAEKPKLPGWGTPIKGDGTGRYTDLRKDVSVGEYVVGQRYIPESRSNQLEFGRVTKVLKGALEIETPDGRTERISEKLSKYTSAEDVAAAKKIFESVLATRAEAMPAEAPSWLSAKEKKAWASALQAIATIKDAAPKEAERGSNLRRKAIEKADIAMRRAAEILGIKPERNRSTYYSPDSDLQVALQIEKAMGEIAGPKAEAKPEGKQTAAELAAERARIKAEETKAGQAKREADTAAAEAKMPATMSAKDAPAPAKGEPDLVLIGCGKKKCSLATGATTAAGNLYTGNLFTARRDYAQGQSRPWAIVSALHGLIAPGKRIGTYDKTMEDMSPAERKAWQKQVREWAHEYFGGETKGKTIEVHAGSEYVNALNEALEGMGIKVTSPMKGKGLVQQVASYKKGFERPAAPEGPEKSEMETIYEGDRFKPKGQGYREWLHERRMQNQSIISSLRPDSPPYIAAFEEQKLIKAELEKGAAPAAETAAAPETEQETGAPVEHPPTPEKIVDVKLQKGNATPLVEVQVGEMPDGEWKSTFQLNTHENGYGIPWSEGFGSREDAVQHAASEILRWIEHLEGEKDLTKAGKKQVADMRDQVEKMLKKEGVEMAESEEAPAATGPVFTRDEIEVSKPQVTIRNATKGGESVTTVKAPGKVTNQENWNRLGDRDKLDAHVEARVDFSSGKGKAPKKTDMVWSAFGGRRSSFGGGATGGERVPLGREMTYEKAVELAKDYVEGANPQPEAKPAEAAKPAARPEPLPAARMTPAERATVAGQKQMASEAASVATVHALNKAVRAKDPRRAWYDAAIEAATGNQVRLNQIRDDLLPIYNELYKKPAEAAKPKDTRSNFRADFEEGDYTGPPGVSYLDYLKEREAAIVRNISDPKTNELFRKAAQDRLKAIQQEIKKEIKNPTPEVAKPAGGPAGAKGPVLFEDRLAQIQINRLQETLDTGKRANGKKIDARDRVDIQKEIDGIKTRLEEKRAERERNPDTPVEAIGEIKEGVADKPKAFTAEVKKILTATLTEQLKTAPLAKDAGPAAKTISIHIPGDGDFRIAHTQEAIGEVLKGIRSMPGAESTAPTGPRPVPKVELEGEEKPRLMTAEELAAEAANPRQAPTPEAHEAKAADLETQIGQLDEQIKADERAVQTPRFSAEKLAAQDRLMKNRALREELSDQRLNMKPEPPPSEPLTQAEQRAAGEKMSNEEELAQVVADRKAVEAEIAIYGDPSKLSGVQKQVYDDAKDDLNKLKSQEAWLRKRTEGGPQVAGEASAPGGNGVARFARIFGVDEATLQKAHDFVHNELVKPLQDAASRVFGTEVKVEVRDTKSGVPSVVIFDDNSVGIFVPPQWAAEQRAMLGSDAKFGAYAKKVFGEELQHVAALKVLRDLWNKLPELGKTNFYEFANGKFQDMAFEIQNHVNELRTNGRHAEAEAIENAIRASREGYDAQQGSMSGGQILDEMVHDPASAFRYGIELTRQLNQLRNNKQLSESFIRRVVQPLNDFYKQVVAHLKGLVGKAESGEISQTLKEILDGMQSALEGKPAEAQVERGPAVQTQPHINRLEETAIPWHGNDREDIDARTALRSASPDAPRAAAENVLAGKAAANAKLPLGSEARNIAELQQLAGAQPERLIDRAELIGDGSDSVTQGEHTTVFGLDPDRVVKLVNEGNSGGVPRILEGFPTPIVGTTIASHAGSPSEYIGERMRLNNEAFGDDQRYHGVWLKPNGEVGGLVISQPFIEGKPPSPEQVSDFMRANRFIQVDLDMWFRPTDNLLVNDTHTGNFLEKDGKVVPIDLQVKRANAAERAEAMRAVGTMPGAQVMTEASAPSLRGVVDAAKKYVKESKLREYAYGLSPSFNTFKDRMSTALNAIESISNNNGIRLANSMYGYYSDVSGKKFDKAILGLGKPGKELVEASEMAFPWREAGMGTVTDVNSPAEYQAKVAAVRAEIDDWVRRIDAKLQSGTPDQVEAAKALEPTYKAAQALIQTDAGLKQAIAQTARIQQETSRQIQMAKQRDIDINEVENYIRRLYEDPAGEKAQRYVPSSSSRGGAIVNDKGFAKSRAFKNAVEAMEHGLKIATMDTAKLVGHGEASLQKMIGAKMMERQLHAEPAPFTGRPVITEKPEYYKAATGKMEKRAPAGYEVVDMGGKPVYVEQNVAGLFRMFNEPSDVRRGLLGRTLLSAANNFKAFTLIIDTYHSMRLAATLGGVLLQGEGIHKIPLGGQLNRMKNFIKRGQAALDYEPQELLDMVKRGQITAEDAQWAKDAQKYYDIGSKAGVAWGRQVDNLYEQIGRPFLVKVLGKTVGHGLETFNEFVFKKQTRAAMMVGFKTILERNIERLQGSGTSMSDIERLSAKETNEIFGNLAHQSWIKGKTGQDIARLFMLAPNWNEGRARFQGRGLIQGAKFLAKPFRRVSYVDANGNVTSKLKFQQPGNAAGTMLALATAMFAGNQVINGFTRGKPTWDNEDGHKFDAYIPGGKNGFFFSPFNLGSEDLHTMAKYGSHSSVLETGTRMAMNKASGLVRGTAALAGVDPLGRPLPGDASRVQQAIRGYAPIPIPMGLIPGWTETVNPDLAQKGDVQRQLFGMLGVKLDRAESPEQRIRAQANKTFPNQFPKSTGQGDFSRLRNLVSNERLDKAADEIIRLTSKGKTREDILRSFLPTRQIGQSRAQEQLLMQTPAARILQPEVMANRSVDYNNLQRAFETAQRNPKYRDAIISGQATRLPQ